MGNVFAITHTALDMIVGLGLWERIGHIVYYYIIEKFRAVSTSPVTYILLIFALLIGALLAVN